MEIEKAEMIRHEWVLRMGSLIIPISAAKLFVETILLFAVAVFAYNVGQNDAAEQIKINSYLTNTGFFNSDTQQYEKCDLVAMGSRLTWECGFYAPNASFNRYMKPAPNMNFTKLNDSIK
jgi:hypothetical protein